MLFHNGNRIFSLMLNMAYPFQQIILATAWKFMKIKENSVFHGVSLNFHTCKLLDAIIIIKGTDFPQF